MHRISGLDSEILRDAFRVRYSFVGTDGLGRETRRYS